MREYSDTKYFGMCWTANQVDSKLSTMLSVGAATSNDLRNEIYGQALAVSVVEDFRSHQLVAAIHSVVSE